MKYAEINKAFTEAVAAKIADGYTICTNTMSGSQGEIAFVNFVKENKFYSLTLDRFDPFGEKENYLEAYVMRFIVSNDLEDGDKIGANLHRTMWRGEKYTTTIEERRWYKIEGADWFVSKEEAVKITKKIKEHWANERDDDIFEFVVAPTPKNRKLCKNRLNIDYTARDAVEDLKMGIEKAEAQRNREPSRGRARIWRNW